MKPTSCDFHEPYFGAAYPDACCINGFLWDLDSCDEPGGPLYSGGDVPCPQCNHDGWLDGYREEIEDQGYIAAEEGKPRQYKHEKVRHEQPGDEAKMRGWWLSGYDHYPVTSTEESPASSPEGSAGQCQRRGLSERTGKNA